MPSRTCLIVDDELGIQSFLSGALRKAQLSSTACSSADEIEKCLEQQQAALIFLDAALDRSDAMDALRRLAALRFTGTIQLMSGKAPEILDDICAAGHEYGLRMRPPLAKPFSLSKVWHVLADEGLIEKSPEPQRLEKADVRALGSADLLCRVLFAPRARVPGLVEGSLRLCSAWGPTARVHDWRSSQSEEWLAAVRRCEQELPHLNEAAQSANLPCTLVMPASIAILSSINISSLKAREAGDCGSLSWLTVELREDEVFADLRTARELILQLRLVGARVRISHASPAFVSLTESQRLPVQEVTLSESLYAESTASGARGLTKVVEIFHRAQIRTIAVCSPVQHAVLCQAGVDLYRDPSLSELLPFREFMKRDFPRLVGPMGAPLARSGVLDRRA